MDYKPPLPRLSIALASATALGYEILLIRLFAVTQWHHFAYMIISLALLGYGMSGTFLSLSRHWWSSRFAHFYIVNLLLFAATTIGCYLLARSIHFNPEELLWDHRQILYLLALYLLLTLPFFFVANAIGGALSHYRSHAARLYQADLLGAGTGSVAIVALLFILFPQQLLRLCATMGIIATLLAGYELQRRNKQVLLVVLALAPWVLPSAWVEPAISPYKGLQQTLQITGTEVVERLPSPLGIVSVVESTQLPLRHAPGMSLNAATEPPEQIGIFTDADNMVVIDHNSGIPDTQDYLDMLGSSLPYFLGNIEQVLILGAGGGNDVSQALRHHAQHIDAVELNPLIVRLLQQRYGDFSGHLYKRPEVELHIAEARGFTARSDKRYDLVHLAMLDAFGAASAGLYTLNENYLYTVEAFHDYFALLQDSGYLSISRWLRIPPRDALKLFATAVTMLREAGIEQPGQHLLLIHGWQTSTLLLKKTPLTQPEIAAARMFTEQRHFDIAYYPGMAAQEANRFNKMPAPHLYHAATALLSEGADTYIDKYKFNLVPATDDRPYFSHFFKWEALPEIMKLRDHGGIALLEWGYPLLIATLLQALLASSILILLPAWFVHHHATTAAPRQSARILFYFIAIGLAFMFLEMAYIQRFILYLSHPLYAVAVVLCAFLLFAGIGSGLAGRLAARLGERQTVRAAIIAIVLFGSGYLLLLEPLFQLTLNFPVQLRILIAIVVIAPLALVMGMPFPMAINHLGQTAPQQVPWAWAVNGCASVISTVLATLLAIHFGFMAVVVLALSLYMAAAASFPATRLPVQER